MIPITRVKQPSFEACAATTKVKILTPCTEFLLSLMNTSMYHRKKLFSRLFHFSRENLYNRHTERLLSSYSSL